MDNKDKLTRWQIRLDRKTAEKIINLSEQEYRSIAQTIKMMINKYLDDLDTKAEDSEKK
jgi:predicted DNA-binding protein